MILFLDYELKSNREVFNMIIFEVKD